MCLFVVYPKLVKEICQAMIDRKIDIKWMACGRVNLMTPEMLRMMKDAGCIRIFYGIESGDQKILDRVKKKTSLDQILETIRMTQRYEIPCVTSFILGLPGETIESMENTINFAVKLNADYATCSLATPYPGTELYNSIIKDGYDLSDWSKYHKARYSDPIYISNGLSSELLKKKYKKFYRKFYLRPRYLLKKLKTIRSVDSFRYHLDFFKGLLS